MRGAFSSAYLRSTSSGFPVLGTAHLKDIEKDTGSIHFWIRKGCFSNQLIYLLRNNGNQVTYAQVRHIP